MILILGGTAEARALAEQLDSAGIAVISSLAGRVSDPRLPAGETRIGGFGGPSALADWLEQREVSAVVDATHPFATRISASAVEAAALSSRPLLRVERPAWQEREGDRWEHLPDLDEAAAVLPGLGRRVFLTSGRQGLAAFEALDDLWFLIRCVEPPTTDLPGQHELLLARGPYTLEGERELFEHHRIDVLVTKNSGGELTQPKLDVARERGLPVVMVDRPPRPDAPTVHSVDEAVTWARSRASGTYVRGV
jgi:precorrin-6A/cobalt-precorrin-6A reductase